MAFLGADGMLNDVTEDAVASVGKGGGKPIPAGWYRAALVEDEAQPKNWGTGLSMQFQILGGDFENRRVFDYLCVRHATSEQAEASARLRRSAGPPAQHHRGTRPRIARHRRRYDPCLSTR